MAAKKKWGGRSGRCFAVATPRQQVKKEKKKPPKNKEAKVKKEKKRKEKKRNQLGKSP